MENKPLRLFTELSSKIIKDNFKSFRKKKIFKQITKTRDEGAGHVRTTERGSKLSVPLRKIHKY